METAKFRTNLHCASCLQKIGPYLDGEESISKWKVDIHSSDKVLTVIGPSVDPFLVQSLMKSAGYEAIPFDDNSEPLNLQISSPPSYFPLILIFSYLVGVIFISEIRSQSWNIHEMMENFMGGFFVIFSFFKVLNLKGFAEAYSSYDLVAQRWPKYSYVYPFIELTLGIGYLLHASSLWLNIATIIVMGVSSLGVIQSLIKKRQIQCACLGTVFNLPMSSVTLVEDLLMVLMAIFMIVFGTQKII